MKEREGRYDPTDKAVQGLKRLNKIDFSGEIHLSDKGSKTDMIIVKPGDLVISGINVSKGALAVYHGKEPITATIHYSSYVFDERQIDIDYFKRFVRSQSFVQALKDQVKGGIKTEIKPKHFLPLEIHLPDIQSQKEIVSFFRRIENEMGDLSGEITHQQSFLKQLRQQILQDAIEGKLTVKWRKQHPDLISGDNHASKLLEKIKAKKERLTKITKKAKALPPITEEEKPFDLPEGWVWSKLGDVILHLPRNGYSPKEVARETLIKSLKLGATTYGKFNPKEFKYIADEIPEDSVFWLEPGDILIQRSNSLDYVGVNAIYTGKSKEFIYPDLMMKIKIMRPLSVNLIYNFLSSPLIRDYFRSRAKGSQQTMPKINQAVVIETLLPLPPLVEQQAIVKRVDKLMEMIDKLGKQVSKRKEQSEMLMQSVLREAFVNR
ncbi:MAG: restriction endonuclease subunit S [Candidatus Brocadiaceae bacterium]|nr:restriction endonuclease subunit S [Candidatus Brocadiaceae bacterium]